MTISELSAIDKLLKQDSLVLSKTHQDALLESNIESQMLVQRKYSSSKYIIGQSSTIKKIIGKFRRYFNHIPVFFYRNRTETFFSPSLGLFADTIKRINEINPDIIHLHWVQGGYLSIKAIAQLNKPFNVFIISYY